MMLEFLQTNGEVSERKARLCVVAWARSFHHHAAELSGPAAFVSWLAGPQWLPQLEAAEGYADGRVDRKQLRATRQETGGPYNLYMVASGIAHFSFHQAGCIIQYLESEFRTPPEKELCDIIRCIFGYLPFRSPQSLARSVLAWNDETIPKLAQVAYEERSLSKGHLDQARLAVLADALEEAGCADVHILNDRARISCTVRAGGSRL
jgi:hypothetical protein